MGDRYVISVDCYKCGEPNHDVYYAPSSGFETFTCEYCKAENGITISFKGVDVRGFISEIDEEEDNLDQKAIKQEDRGKGWGWQPTTIHTAH